MKARLEREEALEIIRELILDASLCMLVTDEQYGKETRPMVTIELDSEGNIWLFAAKFYKHIAAVNPRSTVQLVYAHPSKDSFMSIKGNVNILYDKEQIKEKWNQIMNASFPNGLYDIELCCLVKMRIEEAAYWNSESERLIPIYKNESATETYDQDILAA